MSSITLHGKRDFVKMHKAGRLAAEVLDYITDFIKPNVTTEYLDNLCHNYIISNKAIPAPLNYRGYPKSTCISVNHVVCHGIPGSKVLKTGDILNIDITVICEKPKISIYKEKMKERIAKILEIKKTDINIKGTTTEKLGFLGREEGIACQVSVSVYRINEH